MKKEFSFYEFSGILTPGVFFLFSLNYILSEFYNNNFLEISNLGDAFFQIIIAYTLGHFIQSIGNIYEKIVWFFYGGMPTSWILREPGKNLFNESTSLKIKEKIKKEYDSEKDNGLIIYNKILNSGSNTVRIDIFNSNYSLYRGLSVVCLLLTGILIYIPEYYLAIIPTLLFILSTWRMVHFAKLYAKEIYRSYLNIDFEKRT